MSLFNFDYRNGRLVVAGALLVLGGGMVGGGCGSSEPDVSTQEAFCLASAQTECSPTTVVACYLSNGTTLPTDTEQCITAASTPERCNPGNLPYNPNFAQPCLQAQANVYQSAQLDPTALQQMQQICLAVFNDGGATGATCTDDSGCDVGDGFACIVHAGSKGTCQMPVPAMPGNSCASPNAQCVDATGATDTYYCEATGNCVQDPGNGATCGAGTPCATGLRCDPTSNACSPQLTDGASCTQNSDCVGGFCLATNGGGAVCVAQDVLSFGSPTCADFVLTN
jgi:hypothetical protein